MEETIQFLNGKGWKDKSSRELIENKLTGCKFHFAQSLNRIQKLLDKNESKKLNQLKQRIMNANDEKTLSTELDYLKNQIPITENWVKY